VDAGGEEREVAAAGEGEAGDRAEGVARDGIAREIDCGSGSQERGALYYPESGFPCNPSQVPTGK